MIINSEDADFDAMAARQQSEGGVIFKYGENYWQRLTDNERVFFVLMPRRASRSSLPPHNTFKDFEDYYGPTNE